ncbi:hypothetical protein DAEQUDRAFT_677089 [Daedalea quercina L-15889]|uniref:S5 DRBM domain-containing protein n=1 Tax=Daedalea quercina L-15889 TaxID=1314783 RepID=A0A165M6D1_9APHY|nr:hypothetical protein DAEQUDRAFT_677089 [Daedalea quercina L-15889]
MDLAETRTFEPSRRTKFRNTVTVRNDDQNMFEVLRQQADVETNDEAPSGGPLSNIPFAKEFLDGKLYVAPLFVRHVIQQTPKGRVHRLQNCLVIGNMRGMVGVGFGKHDALADATAIATKAALRSMDYVERFEDRTVWTDMEHKFGSTRIIMRPRPVGFGLRCNPILYHILKAAGIKDISAKVWGSRTPPQVMNCALEMLLPGREPLGMGDGIGGSGKRTEKLMGMRTKDEIERMRGRKMIPLRYP